MDELGDFVERLVLVCALHGRGEVQVESARLLAFDTAEQRVDASEDTTLRLRVAAECILTRGGASVAVRALGAHAYAEELGQHHADEDVEGVGCGERVPG